MNIYFFSFVFQREMQQLEKQPTSEKKATQVLIFKHFPFCTCTATNHGNEKVL